MDVRARLIIDFHVHPFYDEANILKEMEKANVDVCVLLAIDADPLDIEKPKIQEKLKRRHLKSLLGFRTFQSTSIEDEIRKFYQALINHYPELKTTNQEIADLVEKNKNAFIGFGSVNPNKDEEYVAKALDQIRNLGLAGIKMLPTLQFFSPSENENFEMICEFCEQNKKVMLYHTGCDPGPWEDPHLSEDANPLYLEPVLEHYRPAIVLAHAGSYSAFKPGIWFDEAVELGSKFDNVYFDSSAVSSFIFSKKSVDRIRKSIGLDRLLYGSDYPAVWGSNMKYEVDVIKRCSHLTDDEKAKVLGLNAAKLLNVPLDGTVI